MLVLSRKANQEIVIGENIKLTILQVKGNTVRIGIEAPREIRVLRGELAPNSPAEKTEKSELTLTFRNDTAATSSVGKAKILPFAVNAANNSESRFDSDQLHNQPPMNHSSTNRLSEFLAKLGQKSRD